MVLTTPRLQLNDFDVEGWSAEGGNVAEEATETEPLEQEQDPKDAGEPVKVHSLLSKEALGSVNAKIDLNVKEVLSGEDLVGEGQMTISLLDGRFAIEPLHLTVPGGSVDLEFGYHPMADGVELHIKTLVDRFDYGILARRVNPDTKMGGKVLWTRHV